MSEQTTVIELGEDGRLPPDIAMQIAAPPKPMPSGVKIGPSKAEPVRTKSLVKQLRDRLKVVEREIKARGQLEEERGQINRLLHAAKLEKNNLRKLRSVG